MVFEISICSVHRRVGENNRTAFENSERIESVISLPRSSGKIFRSDFERNHLTVKSKLFVLKIVLAL
jgi:hypothetical protein